jgi:predicted dehydrogenase
MSATRVRWAVVGTGGSWIGGTTGSITFGEPLFSPTTLTVATGTPPTPPAVEELTFPREGAGYLPMFRAVNESILAGRTEHPTHPVAATVAVLDVLEQIRERLADERDRHRLASREETFHA